MSKKKLKKINNLMVKEDSLFDQVATGSSKEYVITKAEKELRELVKTKKMGKSILEKGSYAFKAMTLKEFDNGMLLELAVSDEYGVLAIDTSRQIQKEYKCETQGEKIMAEMVALNYCRVLGAQYRIKRYLEMGSVSDNGVKFLAVMSKELDRAQRHLTTSLQTLSVMKQPPMNINVKANVANVASQQIVKNENVNKAK